MTFKHLAVTNHSVLELRRHYCFFMIEASQLPSTLIFHPGYFGRHRRILSKVSFKGSEPTSPAFKILRLTGWKF